MGFGLAAVAAVEIGASIFGAISASSAADEQEQLLEQQETQTEIRAAQEGIARAQKIRGVMAAQTAQTAAGGMSLASPSFQAVQRKSFEGFQQDKDIAAINLSLAHEKYSIQSGLIRDKEAAGIFGIMSKAASQFAAFV